MIVAIFICYRIQFSSFHAIKSIPGIAFLFFPSSFPLRQSYPSIFLSKLSLFLILSIHLSVCVSISLTFSLCFLSSVRLWNDKADWAKLRQKILDSPMSELDVVMLERELTKCNKTMFLASKGLPNNKVVTKLKLSLEEFNPVLPLGTYLLSSRFPQFCHLFESALFLFFFFTSYKYLKSCTKIQF